MLLKWNICPIRIICGFLHCNLNHIFVNMRYDFFMVSTLRGFLFVNPDDVCYFNYNRNDRRWSLVMNDGKTLKLRRETTAETILKKSESFLRINAHQIINTLFLFKIEDKSCFLLTTECTVIELPVSRDSLKEIKNNCEVL